MISTSGTGTSLPVPEGQASKKRPTLLRRELKHRLNFYYARKILPWGIPVVGTQDTPFIRRKLKRHYMKHIWLTADSK
jgi:hypothetical protein